MVPVLPFDLSRKPFISLRCSRSKLFSFVRVCPSVSLYLSSSLPLASHLSRPYLQGILSSRLSLLSLLSILAIAAISSLHESETGRGSREDLFFPLRCVYTFGLPYPEVSSLCCYSVCPVLLLPPVCCSLLRFVGVEEAYKRNTGIEQYAPHARPTIPKSPFFPTCSSPPCSAAGSVWSSVCLTDLSLSAIYSSLAA